MKWREMLIEKSQLHLRSIEEKDGHNYNFLYEQDVEAIVKAALAEEPRLTCRNCLCRDWFEGYRCIKAPKELIAGIDACPAWCPLRGGK